MPCKRHKLIRLQKIEKELKQTRQTIENMGKGKYDIQKVFEPVQFQL